MTSTITQKSLTESKYSVVFYCNQAIIREYGRMVHSGERVYWSTNTLKRAVELAQKTGRMIVIEVKE